MAPALLTGFGTLALTSFHRPSYETLLEPLFKTKAEKAQPVLQIIFYLASAAHAVEAGYVGYLCYKNKIDVRNSVLWVMQTLLVGFPSMTTLQAKIGKLIRF